MPIPSLLEPSIVGCTERVSPNVNKRGENITMQELKAINTIFVAKFVIRLFVSSIITMW